MVGDYYQSSSHRIVYVRFSILKCMLYINIIYFAFYFSRLESAEPFIRKILPDEIWMYRYPNVSSYVPTTILWPLVCFVPVVFIILNFLITKDVLDFKSALLAHTLGIGLNGVIVDIIKITVGRPRPDFFWRCFPDGVMNSEMICTGDKYLVMDGRKSFPSGHSSCRFF